MASAEPPAVVLGHHGSISQVKLDSSSGAVVSAGYDKTLRVMISCSRIHCLS